LNLSRSHFVVACAALIVAFGPMGSRGIWDPDEGRYTNVALNMLDSGNSVDPRRNDDVGHWTKPPLTHWALAASMGLFGRNPWAARLPIAEAFLLTVAITWRLARRLAPGAEALAALVFGWIVPLRTAHRGRFMAALAAFLAVAVPWHAVVAARHPGLLLYFLGAEVLGRVATDQFGRNGERYGWAVVHVPTLLLGPFLSPPIVCAGRTPDRAAVAF
jgi:4-amino-4-deoxy-L-arabinose transferase-like glycosyltransferase